MWRLKNSKTKHNIVGLVNTYYTGKIFILTIIDETSRYS